MAKSPTARVTKAEKSTPVKKATKAAKPSQDKKKKPNDDRQAWERGESIDHEPDESEK